MKLRDLLENVTVQGSVAVVEWKDDTENVLFSTDDFEGRAHNIDESVLDREILYIFPVMLSYPTLKIEVRAEEE